MNMQKNALFVELYKFNHILTNIYYLYVRILDQPFFCDLRIFLSLSLSLLFSPHLPLLLSRSLSSTSFSPTLSLSLPLFSFPIFLCFSLCLSLISPPVLFYIFFPHLSLLLSLSPSGYTSFSQPPPLFPLSLLSRYYYVSFPAFQSSLILILSKLHTIN